MTVRDCVQLVATGIKEERRKSGGSRANNEGIYYVSIIPTLTETGIV